MNLNKNNIRCDVIKPHLFDHATILTQLYDYGLASETVRRRIY